MNPIEESLVSPETKTSRESQNNADHIRDVENQIRTTHSLTHSGTNSLVDAPGVERFRWIALCVTILPVLGVLCATIIGWFTSGVCFYGMLAFILQFVASNLCSALLLILIDVNNKKYEDIPMNGPMKIGQALETFKEMRTKAKICVLFVAFMFVFLIAFLAFSALPLGWWSYIIWGVFTVILVIIIYDGILYSYPILIKATQDNLSTQRSRHAYQNQLIKFYMVSLFVQVFFLSNFIFSAISKARVSGFVGQYSGKNQSINIYSNSNSAAGTGLPLFIEFAVPNWWYSIPASAAFSILPFTNTIIEGSGIIKIAKKTGKSNTQILFFTVSVYMMFLVGSCNLGAVIATPYPNSALLHLTPIESLRNDAGTFFSNFNLTLGLLLVISFCGVVLALVRVFKSTKTLVSASIGDDGSQFFISHDPTIGDSFWTVGGNFAYELKRRNKKDVWFNSGTWKWDVFIGHSRRCADAVVLATEAATWFEKMGMKVWLDVRMDDKSVAAMEKGVQHSKYFVAVMSGPCVNNDRPDDRKEDNANLRRPFCIKEIRWGQQYGKHIQPILRIEDKTKIGEFLDLLDEPLQMDGEMKDNSDLKSLGGTEWRDLDRNDPDFWDLGMKKVYHALLEKGQGSQGGHLDEARVEGVRKSEVFILFLTKGIFTHASVQDEILVAIREYKTIVLLYETDEHQGKKFDWDFQTDVPENFQPIAKKLLDGYYTKGERPIKWERDTCSINASNVSTKQDEIFELMRDKFYESI